MVSRECRMGLGFSFFLSDLFSSASDRGNVLKTQSMAGRPLHQSPSQKFHPLTQGNKTSLVPSRGPLKQLPRGFTLVRKHTEPSFFQKPFHAAPKGGPDTFAQELSPWQRPLHTALNSVRCPHSAKIKTKHGHSLTL